MKQSRDHTCSRTVRTGNANRRLGLSNTFHAKALYNDDPLDASSRLLPPCNKATAVILKFALQNRRRTNPALHLRSIDAAK